MGTVEIGSGVIVVEALHAQLQVGVLGDVVVDEVTLGDFFDAIADGTDITHSKPDPEVFLISAKKIGIGPKDCAVVEDAKAGIEAAKAGGMTALALFGDAKGCGLEDYDLTSFSDLLNILGELWKGGAQGRHSAFLVTLGTGIGGGLVVNDAIINGTNGGAGEIGHFCVEPGETERCKCGGHGCLEQYCSATGLLRQAKKVLAENPNTISVMKSIADLTAKEFDILHFLASYPGVVFSKEQIYERVWKGCPAGVLLSYPFSRYTPGGEAWLCSLCPSETARPSF